MKKTLIFLFVLCLLLSFSSCYYSKIIYGVMDTEIVVKDYKYNYANEQQNPSTTKLFMVDSELYIYNKDRGELYVIRDSEAVKLFDCFRKSDCILIDDDLYYTVGSDFGLDGYNSTSLMHYNLSTKDKICLYENKWGMSLTFKENTLYVGPVDCEGFFSVVDGVFNSDIQTHSDVFVEAFGKRYELRPSSYSSRADNLVVVDGETETKIKDVEVHEEAYESKIIVATEDGIVIHNEDGKNLLYFIDGKTGEVTKLFDVECFDSRTAMNIYEDKVYLSVYRYEGWGESMKGMVGYENDTISGTYEIDLKTGESKQISDQIYDALYIFDSTGIYAVETEGKTYKLDFDGNVIQTIVTSIF